MTQKYKVILAVAVAWTAASSAAEDVWHWRAEKKGMHDEE